MPKRVEPEPKKRMPSEVSKEIIKLNKKLREGEITKEDFDLAIKALNRPIKTIYH